MPSPEEVEAQRIVSALFEDPENNELQSKSEHLILNDAEPFGRAVDNLRSSQSTEFAAAEDPAKPGSWCNCIKEQYCHPADRLEPTNLEKLYDAVKRARAEKKTLRAVGSGHSFSNVAPTDGILLDPKKMNKLLKVNAASLRNPGLSSSLFAVESGITIKDLNTALDEAKLALINMGAYDGQTLAGAISTGTHGKGITLGPLESSVRSLTLVSETGKIYQIEPENGISDPIKFAAANPDIELKQDDEWFYATVVSMGCMGLIYSYTLAIMPTYYLKENRTIDTWENIKSQLAMQADGSLPKLLTDYRHFEIDINPYVLLGKHACVVSTASIVDAKEPSGSRGFANWFDGLLAQFKLAEEALVWALNTFPSWSPALISKALLSLQDKNYIDKSFNILNLGAVNDVSAFAIELNFPVDETLVENIDNVLEAFADEVKARKWYLAGPLGVRFVAASQAYLAPSYGRATCTVEMDMLKGINNGHELLRAVKKTMAMKNPKLRVHWGLDLDTVDGNEAEKTYEAWPKWLNVYRKLNSSGIWNSVFTDRLNISTEIKPYQYPIKPLAVMLTGRMD